MSIPATFLSRTDLLCSLFLRMMSLVGGGFALCFMLAHIGMCLSAVAWANFLEQCGH